VKTYLFAKWRDETGQDMIEYSLLVGMMALAAFAIVLLVGPSLANTFQGVVNQLASIH